jgi:hypothetical protein
MQLQKFCHRQSASSGKYAVNKRIPGILCFISTLMLFLKLHKNYCTLYVMLCSGCDPRKLQFHVSIYKLKKQCRGTFDVSFFMNLFAAREYCYHTGGNPLFLLGFFLELLIILTKEILFFLIISFFTV